MLSAVTYVNRPGQTGSRLMRTDREAQVTQNWSAPINTSPEVCRNPGSTWSASDI